MSIRRSCPRRAAGTVAVAITIAAAAGVVGCSGTTYDASLATTTAAQVTTSTLPTGTTEELLDKLVGEAAQLSATIREHGDTARAAERVDALWLAVGEQVKRINPDLFVDFDAEIAKIHRALRLNRPASADKAYRNLSALVAALRAG